MTKPAATDGQALKLKTLCFDRHVKPRGVLDWLVGDEPRLRTIYVLQPPCSAESVACPVEFPYVYNDWTTAKAQRYWPDDSDFNDAYPNITLPRSTEFVFAETPSEDAKPTEPATEATELDGG